MNKIIRNRGFLDPWVLVVFIGLGKVTALQVIWSYRTFLRIEADVYTRYQSGSIEVAASFMMISYFFQHPWVLLRIFVEELQSRRVVKRFLSFLTIFFMLPFSPLCFYHLFFLDFLFLLACVQTQNIQNRSFLKIPWLSSSPNHLLKYFRGYWGQKTVLGYTKEREKNEDFEALKEKCIKKNTHLVNCIARASFWWDLKGNFKNHRSDLCFCYICRYYKKSNFNK